MPLRPLPDDWCPLTSNLPEGWHCEVTILPDDYFVRRIKEKRKRGNERLADPGKPIQKSLLEE